ncbi:4-(cytidine 5'-diphospho)-2-C-methyl-D-erythritol kinase [Actinopolymorpha alba]|uniref:4-(cytidine 5'-diphospho)-2-C-methyl-D-erythritol kinase n=1 Tax=Actinopolymorpha alba TaxID=533267 RepID=UPI00037DE220|nr:4-(cytidine 5'-diphospho)-2-C-methyl-D-erythritol kinase [Actinopolymorpha alba]
MSAVVVRTPAKVNLALMVGPLRPDGFHELASVYQAVSLYDEVTAAPATAGEISVTVEGVEAAKVPANASNLAVRAAVLLADRCQVGDGVRLHIRKGIPVAGGMAGGSSDAAAALVACDALWGTKLDRTDLLAFAARLGSDVPFCLVGGTAMGSGHGEVVTPALVRGTFQWVFALDTDGLSTPAVYAEIDRMRGDLAVLPPRISGELMAALRAGDAAGLGRALANDLQPATLRLRPRLRQLLEAGEDAGALGAVVSGSGPTCAFLARSADHAWDLAARLSGSGVCSSVRTASGPVPGARIIEP